ncbi:hypothetical protein EB796_015727 [Bugula neritina]|uniref:Uncharacterized protein n=1 Tax=Bugula neritina TaxID=10212 RepID=A0A7J7JK01_BUGNE|nr:hypothetical protein EB796_015727 [Bugula neritina]
MSSLETNNISLEQLTQAFDRLELNARVITDDYAKLNMLSENAVENSISLNFEAYVSAVESTKQHISNKIHALQNKLEEEQAQQKEAQLIEGLEQKKRLVAEEQRNSRNT